MERKIDRSQVGRLILAFLLATLVLSGVFILTNSVTYLNYINSNKQINIISDDINYMKNSSQNVVCSSDFIANTSGTLDLVSKSMTLIESQWGTNDPRVIEEKKLYSDLEAEHLNITLELNKKCGDNFVPVLFFYSNQENAKDKSQAIGFILDDFKTANVERVMIYSFDYSLNSSTIKT